MHIYTIFQVQWLLDLMARLGVGELNSIWGRAWGKDRDNRWKRIESAFLSLVTDSAGLYLCFDNDKEHSRDAAPSSMQTRARL